jgi:hypothetical protein
VGDQWVALQVPEGAAAPIPAGAVEAGVLHLRFQTVEVGDPSEVLTVRVAGGVQ